MWDCQVFGPWTVIFYPCVSRELWCPSAGSDQTQLIEVIVAYTVRWSVSGAATVYPIESPVWALIDECRERFVRRHNFKYLNF
jgi:hypothetical protein